MATWGLSDLYSSDATQIPETGYKWQGSAPMSEDEGYNIQQWPWLHYSSTAESDWTYGDDGYWTYAGGDDDSGDGDSDPMLGDLEDLFQPDLYESSSSYEGLPTEQRDMIANSIIPELIQSALGLEGKIDTFESESLSAIGESFGAAKTEYQDNIADALGEVDEYTKLAARSYEIQSTQALEGAMTDILNELANKNVLNSSIASDTISKTAAEIITTYSEMGYDAAMQAAEWRLGLNVQEAETLLSLSISRAEAEQGVRSEAMGHQAGLPLTLAAIGDMASYSESEASNPLQPYELLADFIANY